MPKQKIRTQVRLKSIRKRISLLIKIRSIKSLKKSKIVSNTKYFITLGEIKVSNVRLTDLVRFRWLLWK